MLSTCRSLVSGSLFAIYLDSLIADCAPRTSEHKITFLAFTEGCFQENKGHGSKHFSAGSGTPSSLHFQLRHELVPLQSEKRSYGPEEAYELDVELQLEDKRKLRFQAVYLSIRWPSLLSYICMYHLPHKKSIYKLL